MRLTLLAVLGLLAIPTLTAAKHDVADATAYLRPTGPLPASVPTLAFRASTSMAAQEPATLEAALGLDRPTRRLIQRGLRNEGFDPGAPDGLFGPYTRGAIRRWQEAGGVSATGYLNGAQAQRLRAAGLPTSGTEGPQAVARRLGESTAVPAPDPVDCEEWNTQAFFEMATVSTVMTCLAAGADVAARTVGGSTPLHHAAAWCHDPSVIDVLLAAGADLTAQTHGSGDTPALLAVSHNENPAVMEALLAASGDRETRTEDGRTLLHLAAQHNENPAMVESLLADGADPTARDDDGDAPLHYAARNENHAVVEAVLAAGANVHARNERGDTPLHVAVWNENHAIVEVVLAAGANVHARNGRGNTPLHYATRNENHAVVEVVLAAGANVHARNESDRTPLHTAAEDEVSVAVVKALLAAGADPTARTDRALGDTPLHFALMGWGEVLAVVEALLAAGADPMARNRLTSTPVHLAVSRSDHAAVLRALLAAGADLEARTSEDITPLHRATRNASPAAIEFLLAAGADVEVRDSDGNTPLHWAAEYDERRHAGHAIEALLNAGASPTARNVAGETPWDVAQENELLRGSDAHWRLNDARFTARGGDSRRPALATRPDRRRAAVPERGQGLSSACSRPRLVGLGVLNSSVRPATIQFSDSRIVIVQTSGPVSTRQESEYNVTADAITYRIVRATGTGPGYANRNIPISSPGPHTVACSLSGRVLSFGDGTWH